MQAVYQLILVKLPMLKIIYHENPFGRELGGEKVKFTFKQISMHGSQGPGTKSAIQKGTEHCAKKKQKPERGIHKHILVVLQHYANTKHTSIMQTPDTRACAFFNFFIFFNFLASSMRKSMPSFHIFMCGCARL